jgi:hypothetical protein
MRVRVVLASCMALAVLGGGLYLLGRHVGGALPLLTQTCKVTAGGTLSLDPDQMANAATIAAVGITRKVPERAVVIALATAQQESKLRNLPDGDRDSIGLFQQRPSQGWGSQKQIADPRYAAGKFYSALLRVEGWEKMPLATAAQRVQRSAYGNAYARWEDEAQILATALLGDESGAVACAIDEQPGKWGDDAAQALAKTVALDWGRVDTKGTSGPSGIELPVVAPRTGWQYAHWLVAHAADQGIKSVSFGGQRWTAKTGVWRKASGATTVAGANSSGGGRVIAEVYTSR